MRNVLVTGGSRGIGLGIVRRLTEVGFRAIAVARKESGELTAAMAESEAKNAGSLRFVPFDLADIEGIADLVKSVRKEFGPIYGLVNNAGTSAEGALALMPLSQIERLVRLKTLPAIGMAKPGGRAKVAHGGGPPGHDAAGCCTTRYRRCCWCERA